MNLAALALALLFAAPAQSDDEVWAAAVAAGSAPAYQTYLLRFPNGAHRAEAIEGIYRAQGLPALDEPPEPPLPPTLVVFPPSPSVNCTALIVGHPPFTLESEERRDYLAVRAANRPAALQAYRAKYRDGACLEEIDFALRLRHEFSRRSGPIAGFGPLAPHALRTEFHSVEDYPARARRNRESGRVAIEFEVAEDGVVEGCHVVRSSGSALLDEYSCRLFVRRMSYDPARDDAGRPVRSTGSYVFDWVLPPG